MEPAVEWQEHQVGALGQVELITRAAMEPAIERREHGLVIGVQPRLDGTAMEPAGDRREHPVFLDTIGHVLLP
jgi:hypothetical protein